MLGPGIPTTLRQDTHLSCCVQSKVAAVHACVPELKRRRAELEAELAISIARHQVLTDELPWHKQLVRSQHYAASDSQKSNMEYEFSQKTSQVLQRLLPCLANLCCKAESRCHTRQE